MAPSSASSVSARIDGRRKPPFQLALAQAQELRQFQLLGDFVQRLLLDQVGAQARQVALVDLP
jgi:hypothetical protein